MYIKLIWSTKLLFAQMLHLTCCILLVRAKFICVPLCTQSDLDKSTIATVSFAGE